MRRSIFLFFLILYLATTAGHIYTIDSYLNYTVTKSIGAHGELSLPRSMMTVEGRGGRHYSKLGIGQSLANLPMYYAGALVEKAAPGKAVFRAYSAFVNVPHDAGAVRAEPQTLIRISEADGARVFFTTLTNAFVAAAVCLLFFMLLRGFGICAYGSFLGTLILGFATPLWVYSRDLFGEPLFALSLLGTFYFIANPGAAATGRRMAFAGLFSSLGILTRMSFAPLVGIFVLYLALSPGRSRERARMLFTYILFSLPGLVATGVLNWVRFESIFTSGYHTAFDKGFSVPLLRGLFYNLASPYRSIFLYAPPAIGLFFGIHYFAKQYREILVLVLTIIAYMFVLYSRWWAWHGGWCWGPRFYLPVMPLFLLPGLAYIRLAERRRLWQAMLVLGAAGFIVQAGGILINYTAVYDYWIKVGKLDWAEAGIHMFSPVTIHWKAILATSPANYDLWLVQAALTAWPAALVAFAALAAGAVFYCRRVRRNISAGLLT